jgi:2-oxoisovalerate dehydrogenase E1 component alpha subunit
MAHQLTGNFKDLGKGRQMPVHYGSKDLNIVTVSSPLTTQVPQASGAGYTFRVNKEDRIAVTYFGDGAASEGDFHSALNFAATLRSQTLFFCRNNMYAISTPVDDQYAGDGIAVRGVAYGMETLRVDGNDLFAIHAATKHARNIILKEQRPVLIEAMSYRVGDHSTSDYSAAYRDEKEMQKWTSLLAKLKSPIGRLESYMLREKMIDAGTQDEIRQRARNEVRDALKESSVLPKPEIDQLFEDVYETMPKPLREQREELKAHLRKYGDNYNLDTWKDGKQWPTS